MPSQNLPPTTGEPAYERHESCSCSSGFPFQSTAVRSLGCSDRPGRWSDDRFLLESARWEIPTART